MAFLHLEALPPRTTKGTLVRLLTQVGQLDRGRIGVIELRGRAATVEVPDAWCSRLVKVLDGTSLANQHIRVWHEHPSVTREENEHFARLLRLLEWEAEAEAEQARRHLQSLTPSEAERTGSSLVQLRLLDAVAGLGGRCLATFGKPDPARLLPWTRLDVGAPVLVSQQNPDGESHRGVVSRRAERTIEVAMAQPPAAGDEQRYRLDLSNDEIARQRQKTALHRAAAAQSERLAVLRDVLLGSQTAGFRELPQLADCEETLNPSQCRAIRGGLAAEDVAIIHGPPGTGKTTTVVELIRQAVAGGEKVLACAPSNLAVDNLLERLLAAGQAALRLGHPARVLPELRDHTLDLRVEQQPDIRLARKLVRDAYAMFDRAARSSRAKPAPGERREQRDEARRMLEDARRLERQVVQQLLDAADVLCVTLTGLDSEILGQRRFDLAVIDEACQSTEPATWIPLLRAHRVVLAGDHCQLPPTVVSREAAREGFAVSLLERLMHMSGPAIAVQLTTQYRMHAAIMGFSSSEFYEASLEADASVQGHVLADLAGVTANALTTTPLLFIDTAGAGYDELQEPDGESRLNLQEAAMVARQALELLAAGLERSHLAVISPYAAQVRLLREKTELAGIEIDTVDGFQGREKEAVLISLVRSNPTGEIGFLSDTRRMNVALTRARRKLIVVGDSATIANHPFYERLLKYLEAQGAYRSVWEWM